MKPDVEEVVRQALALDERGRAEVAARLLDSLEDDEDGTDATWIAEIERRAADLESGAVEGIPWEEVRVRLMNGSGGS